MPELAPGKTIETSGPVLEVTNGFGPGTYHFQLVVVDDAGNESSPALVAVTVTSGRVVRPTPVPNPVLKDILAGRLRDKLKDVPVGDQKKKTRTNPAVLRPIKPRKPS